MRFLVSAGEASSDMYAAGLVSHLVSLVPDLELYGCAGPKLRRAGVFPVINAEEIAVVGLAEVAGHLPGIYRKYRRFLRYIRQNPPAAALLTDSPDFHLRLARHLKRMGIPVYYLVAPQVWAWRQGRVKKIRRLVDRLFCLFPFEETWFRERGVNATYLGHPLAHLVRPRLSRDEFFAKHNIAHDQPLITLLPGSRTGEIARHLPDLLEAADLLRQRSPATFLLATPGGLHSQTALQNFREPILKRSIKILEDETWDCIAYSDLALAASGTVTVEAAILGTPTVTFYKVNALSWHAGRHLVKVPFLSMVNLIAGRQVIPELIQFDMTPQRLAAEAEYLLTDKSAASRMRLELQGVRDKLLGSGDPLLRAAEIVANGLPAAIAVLEK